MDTDLSTEYQGSTAFRMQAADIARKDTTDETLRQNIKHDSILVRIAIAKHENASSSTLFELAHDDHFAVRYFVGKNPNASYGTIGVVRAKNATVFHRDPNAPRLIDRLRSLIKR